VAVLTPATREHLIAALALAIREQRAYERVELRYTRDSGVVAAWEDIKARLERGEMF
jgi:hypothetical protein